MELLVAICTHIMYVSAGLMVLILWILCVTMFSIFVWEKEFILVMGFGFLSLLSTAALCKTIIFLLTFYSLV